MKVNLIPMAGLGTRFSSAGYRLSKPLIEVSGVPMIIKVIRDLPTVDKWIFVMRQEHFDYGVDQLIKREIENVIFLEDPDPQGQASTCMIAEKELNDNDELFIAACDNGFLFDSAKFDSLKSNKDIDSIIWTFTQMETLKRNPDAWGWYKLEADNQTISDISVKVPVSENPYNDHAVTATFYFRKAKDFIDSIKLMVSENYRINNEFYVDAVPRFLQKLNKKTVIFDVDLYVGWGKPDDLYDYERMEFIVKYNINPPDMSPEELRLLPLWKKYFNK